MPALSRMTVRPHRQAPVGRAVRLTAALRASREALDDIQRQLDSLLEAIRAPEGQPEPDSAERLQRATRRAGAAVDRLTQER
jgi:hypothetical protein